MADGAFWEARGNSGVILSQFFRGVARGLDGEELCGPRQLTQAFRCATDAAYSAVGTPVEGTMLTVIRWVAEALESHLEGSRAGGDLNESWKVAYDASQRALEATPTMLDKLREAGVVDAGGMGIAVILGGGYLYLTGADVEGTDLELGMEAGQVDLAGLGTSIADDFLDSSVETEWGYCTQFLIQGAGLDIDRVRAELLAMADSLVIVGDDRFIRVHAHLEDPGVALSYGVTLGELSQIKIDNMTLQNQDWASGHQERREGAARKPGKVTEGLSVVAVAPGDGLAQVFEDAIGARVVMGGQTMNPSVAQLVDAARETQTRDVILLPNNPNITRTAAQAAGTDLGEQKLHVVATRTVPEGIAAALAFNPLATLQDNLGAMEEAQQQVTSYEVTQATRDATIDGSEVTEGQFIALQDGKVRLEAESPDAALLFALEGGGLVPAHIVTIFWGADATEENAHMNAEALEEMCPGLHVDVAYGGQPHYHYIVSVE